MITQGLALLLAPADLLMLAANLCQLLASLRANGGGTLDPDSERLRSAGAAGAEAINGVMNASVILAPAGLRVNGPRS